MTLETVLAGHENWVYGIHWQPPCVQGIPACFHLVISEHELIVSLYHCNVL